MKKTLYMGLVALAVIAIAGVYLFMRRSGSPRDSQVIEWIKNPGAHPDWMVSARRQCANAPFIVPTSGFIGYLWDDTFQPFHRHQGIDIFAAGEVDQTPVYAAYAGFLTRRSDWKSSLIIRIPNDPLQPGRQVWVYYTHMADAQGSSFISPHFPPGSSELPVEAGTLLGYQGNYSGNPADPVGVHLHFSIVKDNGKGNYLNELEINNTLDPSPYLGLNLNANAIQPVHSSQCDFLPGGGL
jgi:peptidoglycan LD-endopeptidase LytH